MFGKRSRIISHYAFPIFNEKQKLLVLSITLAQHGGRNKEYWTRDEIEQVTPTIIT